MGAAGSAPRLGAGPGESLYPLCSRPFLGFAPAHPHPSALKKAVGLCQELVPRVPPQLCPPGHLRAQGTPLHRPPQPQMQKRARAMPGTMSAARACQRPAPIISPRDHGRPPELSQHHPPLPPARPPGPRSVLALSCVPRLVLATEMKQALTRKCPL